MAEDGRPEIAELVALVEERGRLLDALVRGSGTLDRARADRLHAQQRHLAECLHGLLAEVGRELAEVRAARARLEQRSAPACGPLLTSQRA